jgi:OmpA-OmpF porin, OOP family
MTQPESGRNRLHLVVTVIVVLLLILLWILGKGPTSSGCCSKPVESVVAAAPVAASPADADADGVPDATDRCPDTPTGDRVGPQGCSCDVSVQLQYDHDSAKLLPDDMARLDKTIARLKELHFVEGEVGGYADNTGEHDYNLELSQERAQSVVDYLVANGIDRTRITAVGHGEEKPIADNSTAEGRAINRRAVIHRTDCPAP